MINENLVEGDFLIKNCLERNYLNFCWKKIFFKMDMSRGLTWKVITAFLTDPLYFLLFLEKEIFGTDLEFWARFWR